MFSTQALSTFLVGVLCASAVSAQRSAVGLGPEPVAEPGGVQRALGLPQFSKAFAPATIGPGSTCTLTFSIANPDGQPVSGIAFTDVLPAGMLLATPANASTTLTSGVLTAPDGGTTVSYVGGRLGGNTTATITVDVVGSTPGALLSVSGDLTSSAGNSGTATATLNVDGGRPGLSKSFSPGTVPFGGTSRLVFTFDNTANGLDADSLFFQDVLPAGMVIATPSNASISCPSTPTPPSLTAIPGSNTVSYSFGRVSAGTTCSVSLDVVGTQAGLHLNRTSELLAGSSQVSCGFATAVLQVDPPGVGGFTKSFIDDPVQPGDTVTLEYTITNFDRSNALTGIRFSDDLGAALTGLAATGLPASGVCGAGSTLAGTTVLTLTGGSLAPQTSCTIRVTLRVPSGATPGAYPSTSSALTADGGVMIPGATDTLRVETAPRLTKQFLEGMTVVGGDVTLAFTITNTSPTSTAKNISFSDDLDAFLPGIAVTQLPPPGFCGAGSMVLLSSEPQVLTVTGVSLAPGASCSFALTLELPSAAPTGSLVNTTSVLSADLDDGMSVVPVVGAAATGRLLVLEAPVLSKRFTDDPTVSGQNVTLEYTLSYPGETGAPATGISFVDDLDAALSGLVAVGPAQTGICGPGSSLSGTNVLTFTGGSLVPGATCTFSVQLQVPQSALPGRYPSTTSEVSSLVGSMAGATNPAVDTLDVGGLSLAKRFLGQPARAGRSVQLEYRLTNEHPLLAVTEFSFTDDLDAALHGLLVEGLPVNGLCGPTSQLSGARTLTFTGGSLAPETSCTFEVTVDLWRGIESGEYRSVATDVTAMLGGVPVVLDDAVDTLSVANPPNDIRDVAVDGLRGAPVASGGTFGPRGGAPGPALAELLSAADVERWGAVLAGPTAVAVSPAGVVYVAGRESDNVLQITDAGLETQSIREVLDRTGSGPGTTLVDPVALAVEEGGSLLVAGRGSDNVFRVTRPGLPEQSIEPILDATGAGPGRPLSRPSALALDGQGNVYVSGGGSDNVLAVSPQGLRSQVLGARPGSDRVRLRQPAGLAVDLAGNLYVAGRGSDNVVLVAAEGRVEEVLTTEEARALGLGQPQGLAVNAAGDLLVSGFASDNLFRIREPARATRSVELLVDVTGDGLGNELHGPTQVAFDAAGNAYVAGSGSANAFRVTLDGVVVDITQVSGSAQAALTEVSGLALFGPYAYLASRGTDQVFRITTLFAGATARNAGSNPESYRAAPPVVGEPWTASVDLAPTGHSHAVIFGHATPANLRFAGRDGGADRTLLVGGTRLFLLPAKAGPVANWRARIPSDASLMGYVVHTQAAHVSATLPFVLSNAQDLVIGY